MKYLRCTNKAADDYPDISTVNQTYSDRFYNSKEGFDAFGNPIGSDRVIAPNHGKLPDLKNPKTPIEFNSLGDDPMDAMNRTYAHNNIKINS